MMRIIVLVIVVAVIAAAGCDKHKTNLQPAYGDSIRVDLLCNSSTINYVTYWMALNNAAHTTHTRSPFLDTIFYSELFVGDTFKVEHHTDNICLMYVNHVRAGVTVYRPQYGDSITYYIQKP